MAEVKTVTVKWSLHTDGGTGNERARKKIHLKNRLGCILGRCEFSKRCIQKKGVRHACDQTATCKTAQACEITLTHV